MTRPKGDPTSTLDLSERGIKKLKSMQIGLKKLGARHFKIVQLCLNGLTGAQISRELGMQRHTISAIINSPLFQTELSRHRESTEKREAEIHAVAEIEARDLLRANLVNAVNTHVGVISDKVESGELTGQYMASVSQRQRSASEILDRGGLGKTTEQIASPTIVIKQAQIAVIEQAHVERFGSTSGL